MRLRLIALLPTLALLAACKKDDPPPAASAAPPAPPPPVASAPAQTGGACPPGSSGAGTPDEPCKGPGRVIEAKWTGKTGKTASLFTVSNKLPYKVDFVQARGYYYDKAGKLLEVKRPADPRFSDKYWGGSGGLISMGPNETKEIELGWNKEVIPKTATTIEIEFNKVGWAKEGSTDDVYWENPNLVTEPRAPGGNKP